MRIASSVLVLTLPFVVAATATAQGRGRGRAEEIQRRVGAYFVDTKAPAPAGDTTADLATADLVRAATGAGQPTVLYLVDGGDDEDVRDQFERTVFGGDEIGIMLRCFHCGRIDLKTEPALQAKFAKQQPLFLAFDHEGKPCEPLSMSGYKAQPKALETLLVKAAQGTVKPSLTAFAKEYGGFVRDLEQVLAKKKLAKERHAKTGGDKVKRADVEKDLAAATKEEEQLLDREQALLGKVAIPERPAEARRLGGRNEGGRGDGRGGQGGGQGGGQDRGGTGQGKGGQGGGGKRGG